MADGFAKEPLHTPAPAPCHAAGLLLTAPPVARDLSGMAGYSGTPLPVKLGIKPGCRLGLAHPPVDVAHILGALPDGVSPRDAGRGRGPFDVIVCFVSRAARVAPAFAALKARLDPAGGLWMAWPKKKPARDATAIVTDVSEGVVRDAGLAAGLVDNKVCAIDEVWSGLRFVVRLADRPKAAHR